MSDNFISSKVNMHGHITIRDVDTNEILVDKDNQIHYEHMSITLARALARQEEGYIYEMHFGNGGSAVSGTGSITYFPPNVVGNDADLYNRTYFKRVNGDVDDPANNFVEVRHLVNTVYSDIIITCTLDYGEPADQEAFDTSELMDPNTDSSGVGKYVFDELGLKTYDYSGAGNGLLLSHVIFNPIQKSLNRKIEVVYTIRITVV